VEKNQLYYGDNLAVLREHIKDESVDLIYLDPPFNSRQDYNVLFAERDGTRSASQIMAFEDTWEWNMDAERAYEEIVERGGPRLRSHARLPHLPRPLRHDGVPRDDGPAAG
jgi:16S rRNA G966 N2-methylase RsmD